MIVVISLFQIVAFDYDYSQSNNQSINF